MISVPFTTRSKEYGYIIWSKKIETEIEKHIPNLDEVILIFNGDILGTKRVDWKSRRISIGYKYTRYLPDKYNEIQLEFEPPNKLLARLA